MTEQAKEETRLTNAKYAKENADFREACKIAGIEPSAAQASKYRRGYGLAFTAAHNLPVGFHPYWHELSPKEFSERKANAERIGAPENAGHKGGGGPKW